MEREILTIKERVTNNGEPYATWPVTTERRVCLRVCVVTVMGPVDLLGVITDGVLVQAATPTANSEELFNRMPMSLRDAVKAEALRAFRLFNGKGDWNETSVV